MSAYDLYAKAAAGWQQLAVGATPGSGEVRRFDVGQVSAA